MSNDNSAQAPLDPLIGRLVQGRFEVVERLAAGGMGVVYKAIQQPLGRPVALKILEITTGPANDPTFQQRFFLEASAASKLGHPNTIVVHDYGKTEDDKYFIAMEYLDGGSLAERLRASGPLPPVEALHVALQIVSSLADAHAQGLVHRDLKPGNVMFAPRAGDDLFVKVLDFGLVKVVGAGQGDLGLTRSGVMMGSPRYMAPEQVKAQPVDGRTDIYSLGAVFFHMITGGPPFGSGSAFEAMNHHVYTPAPAFREVWPDCPASPDVEAIVHRCLAKEPSDRFASMDELLDALRRVHLMEAGGSSSSPYLMAPSGHFPAPSLAASDSHPSLVRERPAGEPPPAHAAQHPASAQPLSAQHPASAQPPSAQPVYQKTQAFDPGQLPAAPQPGYAAASVAQGYAQGYPSPDASGAFNHASSPSIAGQKKRGNPIWKVLAIGLVFAVVAVGAAGIALVVPLGDPSPAEDEPSAPTTSATAATPPSPPVAPPIAPPPVAETPTPPTPAAVAPAPMVLRTDPSGATVRRDGQDLGDTPLPLLIPTGVRWTITVTKRGFEPREVRVAGGHPELTLHLTPIEEEETPTPTARRGRRTPPPQPVVQPVPQPLAPANPPTSRRGRRPVYAPDLDDPWANQ